MSPLSPASQQNLLSAISTSLPWRYPFIDADEVGPLAFTGFSTTHQAALVGLYSGVFTEESTSPTFAPTGTITTIGILNHHITWIINDPSLSGNEADLKREDGEISLVLQYGSGTGDNEVDEVFHDNLIYNTSTIKEYDLLNLTGELLDFPFVKSFSRIKSITVYNTSGDDVPVNFGDGDSFGSIAGFASNILVPSGSTYHINAGKEGWPVESGNSIIRVGDGTNRNNRYELVILGDRSG